MNQSCSNLLSCYRQARIREEEGASPASRRSRGEAFEGEKRARRDFVKSSPELPDLKIARWLNIEGRRLHQLLRDFERKGKLCAYGRSRST